MTRDAASSLVAPTCDILLLVATETEEEALVGAARDMDLRSEERETPVLGRYLDLGTVGTDRVLAVRTRMGTIGHGGAAHKAVLSHNITQAPGLIQVGMAFGVDPATQRIGDVLVGRAVVPYDDRAVREADGRVFNDYTPMKRRHGKKSLIDLFAREAVRVRRDHKVHFGAMLSGSARIYSATFRDQLVREIPATRDPIVGGEMEGVGVMGVSPAAQPLWAIVKGISDFADTERDAIIGHTKGPACRNAAHFVLSALKHRNAPPSERS